jgi:(p)ppGpp synthase/HD superfamily hydrolase
MKERAILFATEAHGSQVRKYCGSPYITHPIAVSEIVESVDHTEEMVVAAILHDVVEDTEVTIDEITKEFGPDVAELVYFLTDISVLEDGNRAHRKQLDAEHNAKGPAGAQTVKVADLIHNSSDISVQDPRFWKTYKIEKLHTLSLLDKADPSLKARARAQIMDVK